jgi:Flp pilus assembly protein TadG
MRGLRRTRTGKAPDSGASAVEFALVLPVLLLLVFGVITFGFAFAAQISLNSAARDASRAAVVQPLTGPAKTCSAVATMARTATATAGLDPMRVGVTVTGPNGATVCSLATNTSAVSGSSAAEVCTGSISGGQLVVGLAYTAQTPVPMPPFSAMNLSANGRFQCEYN